MINSRVAILGLFCLGAAIAHNCEQAGHSQSDHQGSASQQSFSSSSNFISAGQGGETVTSFGGHVNGVPFGGTFNSNNGQLSGVTHGLNSNSNTGFGTASGAINPDVLYNPGNLQKDLPGDTPYWWMNDQSPFKQENSLQGCDPSKGCNSAASHDTNAKGGYIKMDLSQNPFINGNYISSQSSNSAPHSVQSGHSSVTNQEINLSNNPFIGGQTKPTYTGHTSNTLTHTGSGTYNTDTDASKPIDLSGNPFLNGGSSNHHSGSTSTNSGSLTHTHTTGSGNQFASGSNQHSGSGSSISPGSVTHSQTQKTGSGAYNSDLSGNPFLNGGTGYQSTGAGSVAQTHTGSGNQFPSGSGSQSPCSGSSCSGFTSQSQITTGSGAYDSGNQFSSGSGTSSSHGSKPATQTTGFTGQQACSGTSCSGFSTQSQITTGSGAYDSGNQFSSGSGSSSSHGSKPSTQTQTTGFGGQFSSGSGNQQACSGTSCSGFTSQSQITTGSGAYDSSNQFSSGSGNQYSNTGSHSSVPSTQTQTTISGGYDSGNQFPSGSGSSGTHGSTHSTQQTTGSGSQFPSGSGSKPSTQTQTTGFGGQSYTTGSGTHDSGNQFSSGSGSQHSGSGPLTQTQTTSSGSKYTNEAANQYSNTGFSNTGSNSGSKTQTQTTGSGNYKPNLVGGSSSTQYSGASDYNSLTQTTQTTGYGTYNSGSSGPDISGNKNTGFQSNFASSGFSSNGNKDYTSNSLTSGFASGPIKGNYGTVNAERGYLPPVVEVSCSGPGKVCALKQQCQNGFISDTQAKSSGGNQNQICNADREVCCTVQATPRPTPRPTPPLPPQTSYQPKPTSPPYQPPKPTQPRPTSPPYQPPTPTLPPYQPPKPTQPRPTSPPYQPQSTPCGQRSQTCVKPDQCQNGVVRPGPGTNYNQRPAVDKCYAPEVCCRIPDEVPNPSIKIPNNEYLPQPEPQPDNNNPNYIQTKRPFVPPQTPRPFVPPVQTQRPYVPPVQTQRPYVPPVQTQRPYVPPVQTQRPYVPPVQTQRPYVPPVQTQRPYVPPVQTQRPYVPPVQTQRPYVPPVQTQRPFVQPTKKPFQGDTYIPPKEIIGQPTINRPNNVLPPYRGDNDLSEQIYPGQSTNDQPTIIRPNNDLGDIQAIPLSCAAALNCTEIQFCNAQGVISKTPVILTRNQELFRVPLSDCRSLEKGFVGKCCRDPDYVDPWPVTDLGRYRPEIFGGGKYKPSSIGKYQPPVEQYTGPAGVCGQRMLDTLPRGNDSIDTGFGEVPWQAMVLSESRKSILCGGSIIGEDTIITAGNCVNGLKPTDVMIKAGEWRLGVDEEPTFQIIRVKSINFQPTFRPKQYDYDVALLHLEAKLNWTQHIQPICIEDPHFPAQTNDSNCITTGWGKDVIKIHLKDAIMHLTNVTVHPHKQCESQYRGYNQNGSFCGTGGHDLCLTDVGSGLACTSGKEQYLLRGVYATETGCKIPNQLGSFAKIDVKWVNAAIQDPTLENYIPEPEYSQQGNSPQGVKSSFPHGVKTSASQIHDVKTKYLPPVY